MDNTDRSLRKKPEILLLKGGIENVATKLALDAKQRIGIVGGRWSGVLKRTLLPKFPSSYIIEDKAFSDTAAIVAVGGESQIARGEVIAKRFACDLYIIMTTPALPQLVYAPKQILACGEAIAECGREATIEAFCSLAGTAAVLADRLTSDILNDSFSPPVLAEKAYGVLNKAFGELESAASAARKAYVIAEANLGMFAVFSALRLGDNFTRALRRFKGFCGKDASHEKEFLFALVLTRYQMSRLGEDIGFIPPPYMNGRLKRAAAATFGEEISLYKKFSQSQVNFERIRPRIDEFREELNCILNRTDDILLRALRILKRLRFDCGEGLSSLICYDEIKNALALLPELCTCPTFLTALRDRGDLDLLLA